jgi:CRP/FNR family transcriptional regulator
MPAVLDRLPLLERLEPGQRRQAVESGFERRLDQDEFLFHEGEPATAMFAVIEGRLKLLRTSPDGKELLLHLVNPGQTFAEAALFGRATYPATAQAVAASAVWCFPRDRLLAVIGTSPELGLAMLASLSHWTRRIVAQLDLLTQRRVEERLAVYLVGRSVDGSPEQGQRIQLEDAKNLIAAQIGTAPEVLSRTFRRLEDDGVLRVTARSVEVLDPEALRELASWIDDA